ncbi:MAG: Zn-dependent alcohol dehydrogenase [Burkholderiaceae bacterium]|nr:Zn-dependent alcohol dehydrogenase [Burkholderiaceae bacterium]
MRVLSAVFHRPGDPLSVEDIELDAPRTGELLVRIEAVGLCRTDWHVMQGERQVAMSPMVLGHEGAGVVEALGPGVDGIAVGDHVVLAFIPGCGSCRWCRQGRAHLCALGPRITQGTQVDGSCRRRDASGREVGAFCMIGAFAQRTVVHQASVVVIDRDLPLDLASLVACGVPAGIGAARHRARVKPGDSVLVVGVGGDGINVVQGAKLAGATTIIAADVVARKLEWARAFGATHTVDSGSADLVVAVHAVTDGVGVDHAFVCIDPPATLLPAFRATAKAGNVVVTALTPTGHTSLPVPPLELVTSQKAIMGSVYGFASPRVQIPELIALYRRGAIRLAELVTRRYPLAAINEGYADLIAGRNLRGVVLPFA